MTKPGKGTFEERYYLYKRQRIHLHAFPSRGYILDIGGGGEGVIGQLVGRDVIAIDVRRSELEEAADNGLKIVMDARDLQFLDGTFSSATAFFSLMYVRDTGDCRTVMAEVFRVLQPNGEFRIWDTQIPERPDVLQPNFAVQLQIVLSDREIETGYGQPWPSIPRDLTFYRQVAIDVGFNVMEATFEGICCYLRLQKPADSSVAE